MNPEDDAEEDGANIDLDSQRKGKCVVLKTSTRQVLTMEKFEHLQFLIYFGEKGSERIPLSQSAPFFANSDPGMPAAPVSATLVHDWLLQKISSALEHISERVSAEENGSSSDSYQDVAMADACVSSIKALTSARGPSFVEGISKSSYVKQASDLKGSSVKAVPRKRFHDVVVKNGLGLTVACMAMSSAADCPADETNLTGVGEIRLIPDLSTKCIIPWSKQEEMVLGDMHLKPGEAWEYCPREALRRVSKILKDEFNLVMYAGFESEFYLLKSALREGKEEWFSFDTTPYCSASAFDAASPVLHEVVAALQSLNIAVEQVEGD